MPNPDKHIFQWLQQDILLMQGFKPSTSVTPDHAGLGPMIHAFPNSCFPKAAVHEFISEGAEDGAATGGFICGLLSSITANGKALIWVSRNRTLFPPALNIFGIPPEQVIFIDPLRERDILWTIEEALKCSGLAAVIGEIPEMDFTASRRLQLAIEQSGVTGIIHRRDPRKLLSTLCNTRWKIRATPSELPDDLPGVGFPSWKVELLKVRNGKPGTFQVQWKNGKFDHPVPEQETYRIPQRKSA